MLPNAPINDLRNNAPTDSVFICQHLLCYVRAIPLSDVRDSSLSEFCCSLLRSARCVCPTSLVSIFCVIRMCSRFEVRRVAARFVVASVPQYQACGNGATRQLERYPMGQQALLSAVNNAAENSISGTKPSSCPNPAFVFRCNFDSPPESIYPTIVFEIPVAPWRAIFTRLRAHLPRGKEHFSSTVQTITRLIYDFCGQGVNLLQQGYALARPVQSRQRLFGPLCILAREAHPCR